MKRDSFVIRSTVLQQEQVRFLWRGAFLGGLGGIILVYTGSQWSLETLQRWGAIVFFLGVFCIASGLIPYRRLMKQLIQPATLSLIDEEILEYRCAAQLICQIPVANIQRLVFVKQGVQGGIALFLHSPLPSPLCSGQSLRFLQKWQQRSKKIQRCDLFFPRFSRHSFDLLIELLHSSELFANQIFRDEEIKSPIEGYRAI